MAEVSLIIRNFRWDDRHLVLKLMGLNLEHHHLRTVMKHEGEPFNLFIRGREPDFLYPEGSPPERWEFEGENIWQHNKSVAELG